MKQATGRGWGRTGPCRRGQGERRTGLPVATAPAASAPAAGAFAASAPAASAPAASAPAASAPAAGAFAASAPAAGAFAASAPAAGPRGGHTLAELVVGLLLASLVGAAAVALLHASSRAVVDLVARSESSEFQATVAALLHAETSIGRQGPDWEVESATALRLRAFRGYALPCEEGLPDPLPLVRLGDRAPDPGRDSVLVITRQGRRLVVDLTWVGPQGGGAELACPALHHTWTPPLRERWRLVWGAEGPPTGDAIVLLRYFERGRYSLEDGAFRYRQGTGARQPLTTEVLPPGSGFGTDPSGQPQVHLPPLAWPLAGDPTPGAPLGPSPGGGFE